MTVNADTAVATTRAMPKRAPRLALNCEAPMKPIALTEKATLNSTGVRPKWLT